MTRKKPQPSRKRKGRSKRCLYVYLGDSFGFTCTLPAGHKGHHEAWGAKRSKAPLRVWDEFGILPAQRGPTAPPSAKKEQYVSGEVIGGGIDWSWKAAPPSQPLIGESIYTANAKWANITCDPMPPSKHLICKARGTIDVKGVYVEPEHSIVTLSGHVRPFADQQPRILSQMDILDARKHANPIGMVVGLVLEEARRERQDWR